MLLGNGRLFGIGILAHPDKDIMTIIIMADNTAALGLFFNFKYPGASARCFQ